MKVVAKINSSQDGLVFDTDGMSQTLSAGHGNVPKILIKYQKNILANGNIRRLTEIECERLQGFKDNHTQSGCYPTKKVTQKQMNKMSNEELIDLFKETIVKKIPRGQRYKLIGNAVTTNCVKEIGLKLL